MDTTYTEPTVSLELTRADIDDLREVIHQRLMAAAATRDTTTEQRFGPIYSRLIAATRTLNRLEDDR